MFSKPPLPYVVGGALHLQAHEPPPPVKFDPWSAAKIFEERRSVDPLDLCLRHPPSKGTKLQSTANVQIVRQLRAGDRCRAQIVAIRATPSSSHTLPSDKHLVAKIYDPMYFDDNDDSDPFLLSDVTYTHEAAAYKQLSALQGSSIAKYFGSFTTTWPDKQRRRLVRLVLIELLPGRAMDQLTGLPRSPRQSIMKKVIDAETDIYTHNITHKDLRPANIMVDLDGHKVKRIVMIDFGLCKLKRIDHPSLQAQYLPGVPISPLLMWRVRRTEFDGFVDWDWTPWLHHVYKSTEATITDHMREIWGGETAPSFKLCQKPPP